MIAGQPFQTKRRPPVKRRLRDGLLNGLQRLGVASVYGRCTKARGGVILMYHTVAGEARGWVDPANWHDPDLFARQMAFLARRRNVVSLEVLLGMVAAGETPPRGTVAITFDDAYLDNLTVAAPILARYGLPATLFVPTGYIDAGRNMWIDDLYCAFRYRTRDGAGIAERGVSAAYGDAASELTVASYEERAVLLEQLREALAPQAAPPRLLMDWDDLRRLRDDFPLFTLGAHTVSHPDLTSLPEEDAARELTACRDRLAEALGVVPRDFAFPYNRRNDALESLVAEAGYRAAMCSGESELITPASNFYQLPRVEAPRGMTWLAYVTGGAFPALEQRLRGR